MLKWGCCADTLLFQHIARSVIESACPFCRETRVNCPRTPSRRAIPFKALLLKKNRCGTSPVSKTSDNEHTAASLGYSKVLSVKNSVCEPIPELPQHPEEGSKIPSSITGHDAGDVLPYQPFGAIFCSNGTKGEHEVATRIIQSFSQSCGAE